MHPNEQVLAFIKANQNTNKVAITTETEIKGLQLFNILKKLLSDGEIISTGEGNDTLYSSVVKVEAIADEKQDSVKELTVADSMTEEQTEANTATENETEVEESKTVETETKETEPITKKTSGRNNDKFKFEGEEYGKGALVRAVLKKYVSENVGITYKQLKEVFPDTLLKRFGIFEEMTKARELSGKYERYCFKEEEVVKLKDKKVVVCTQFTAENIQGFLKVAKELGYKIQ